MSVFRTATTQAILDIISEHASESRFGQLLTEEDSEAVAARVVDLFEMTIELRTRTGLIGGGGQQPTDSAPAPTTRASLSSTLPSRSKTRAKSWAEEEPGDTFPTTVNAEEFYDRPKTGRSLAPETPPESEDPGAFSFKLPRTRKMFSDSEKLSFMKRRKAH